MEISSKIYGNKILIRYIFLYRCLAFTTTLRLHIASGDIWGKILHLAFIKR